MPELKIYGASDDLVEVEGALRDEFNADSNSRWVGEVIAPNGDGLLVTAAYLHAGVWALGVGPTDEGAFLPAWDIRVTNCDDNDYSAMLVITVPDATVIREVSG